jgi:phosphatidylserine/phosphatidylglycerophosphate/cardiolipin synthase-like enzyme
VKSYDPSTTEEAVSYLDELWNNNRPTITDSKGIERQAFLSESEYFDYVIDHIKSAGDSIRVMMYQVEYKTADPTFFPTLLLEEIKKAYDRGVDVKVIVDDKTASFKNTVEFFRKNNLPFQLDKGQSPTIHAKMLIVDDTAYIGSHNWIESGFKGEATLMIREPVLVSDAIDYFESKWMVGRNI